MSSTAFDSGRLKELLATYRASAATEGVRCEEEQFCKFLVEHARQELIKRMAKLSGPERHAATAVLYQEVFMLMMNLVQALP